MKTLIAALLATLSASFATPPAFAAQVVSGTLYEDSGSCGGTNSCSVEYANFPSAVQGRLIRFEMVSCNIITSDDLYFLQMLVYGDTGGTRSQFVTVPYRSGSFTFNQPVDFTVGGNTTRRIALSFSNLGTGGDKPINAACFIVGTILN